MIKVLLLLALASIALASPWYYYGGPGFYHGHYSRGFPGTPGYNSQQYFVSNRHKREASSRYAVAALNPVSYVTHYGYPHYFGYGRYNSQTYPGYYSVNGRKKRSSDSSIYSYGRYGYYGAPWWSGHGRWGYYGYPAYSHYF